MLQPAHVPLRWYPAHDQHIKAIANRERRHAPACQPAPDGPLHIHRGHCGPCATDALRDIRGAIAWLVRAQRALGLGRLEGGPHDHEAQLARRTPLITRRPAPLLLVPPSATSLAGTTTR